MVRRLGLWVLWCFLWAVSGAAAMGALGCDRPLRITTAPERDGAPDGPVPALDAATADTAAPDAGAGCPATGGPVVACGCGCCGGAPSQAACYYPSRGESPGSVDPPRTPESCANVGCSLGSRYLCCGAPDPLAARPASYCAYDAHTNQVRYEVLKMLDGICTRLVLEGGARTSSFPVSAPADLALVAGSRVQCQSSAAGTPAIGALGTVAFDGAPGKSSLDVHLTLFFPGSSNAVGTAEAVRFDVDNLPLDGNCMF